MGHSWSQDIGLDELSRGSYVLSNHCPEMKPQTGQLPGNMAHRVLTRGEPGLLRSQALQGGCATRGAQPYLCHMLDQPCHYETVPFPLVLREYLIIIN